MFSKKKVSAIGQGISGKVELVEKGSDCYVVKTYHSKESYESRKEYRDRVLHEYRVISALNHPNIIKAFKYKVSLDGLSIKIYLEAGSCNLLQARNKTKLDQKSGQMLDQMYDWWIQTCRGVRYLHETGFCHRDLKLENLVLDREGQVVKIIDMATVFSVESPNLGVISGKQHGEKLQARESEVNAVGVVGSAKYMAPETASSISYHGKAVDIWSLGIVLFYLTTKTFPWQQAVHTDPEFAEFQKNQGFSEVVVPESSGAANMVYEKALSRNVLDQMPQECRAVMRELLEIDPKRRFSIEEVFGDPWVQKLQRHED